MPKLYLVLVFCLFSLQTNAQVDGVYQFVENRPIHTLIDAVNENILHIGTTAGYLSYNLTTGQIERRLNATSQNPGLSRVISISQNPTNTDELAFMISDGFGIFENNILEVFYHDNSNFSLAEGFGDRFDLNHGNSGKLFITSPLVQAYQIYENGVISNEIETGFFLREIVDNSTGTKRYFSTFQEGIYVYDVINDTFAQFTEANSNLVSDIITDILIDANDLVHISTTSGISTIDDSEMIESYQSVDPSTGSNFSIQSISINDNGLIAGSLGATSFNLQDNFFTLNITDTTWSVYTPNDNGCAVEEVANVDISNDGIAYTTQNEFTSATGTNALSELNTVVDACTIVNPDVDNRFFVSIAPKQIQARDDGNVAVFEFTKVGDNRIASLNIDPDNFDGTFNAFQEFDMNDDDAGFTDDFDGIQDFVVVLRENGYEIIDSGFDTSLQFTPHGISDFNADAFVTAQNANPDDDNKAFFVIRGQNQVTSEFLVYKQECDFTTGICSEAEELFDENRDKTNSCTFGANYHPDTDELLCSSAKFTDTGFGVTQEAWDGSTNGAPVTNYDGSFSQFPFGIRDPVIIQGITAFLFINQVNAIFVDALTGNVEEAPQSLDIDGNGTVDDIVDVRSERFTNSSGLLIPIGTATTIDRTNPSNTLQMATIRNTANTGETPNFEATPIADAFINNLPRDVVVASSRLVQYNATTAIMIVETFSNGLLIKTNISINDEVLGLDESLSTSDDVSIFPNPASNVIQVIGEDIEQLTLYNLNGRKMISETSKRQLDLSAIASGIYLLELKSSDGRIRTKKIVRE